MLRSLDVRDVLIIDRLELEFRPGLNVLTGETGAGKSILLDALGFVLGWRGRAELVRSGAERGEVTAVFELPPGHPGLAVLAEAGIEVEDELILRRVNTAEGRKTAWINDRRASGEVLRRLSETLVELHGQHDDRGLLNPRGHRVLLDAFAGAEAELAACRAAWRGRAAAAKALASAEAAIAETPRRGGVPAPRRGRARRAGSQARRGGRARREAPPDAGRRAHPRRRGPRGPGAGARRGRRA